MSNKIVDVPGLPIGYRFLPSAEVLIRCYLINKNISKTLPANVIPDIHADQIYVVPPQQLVADTPCTTENEWYYFIHGDAYFQGEKKEEHIVGNKEGFWRCGDEENPIFDKDDKTIAFKICYDYFSGSVSNPEKQEWRLEKYRLPYKCEEASSGKKEGWLMGRIIKGNGYESA